MAEVPTNEKLWAMVVNQAKAKYHPYPSPGASAWVHKHYEELGGRFEDTSEATRRKKILKQMWEKKMREKNAHGNHSAKDEKKKGKK